MFHVLAFPPWKYSLMIKVFKNPLQLVHWVALNWSVGKCRISNFLFQMQFIRKHSAEAQFMLQTHWNK